MKDSIPITGPQDVLTRADLTLFPPLLSGLKLRSTKIHRIEVRDSERIIVYTGGIASMPGNPSRVLGSGNSVRLVRCPGGWKLDDPQAIGFWFVD